MYLSSFVSHHLSKSAVNWSNDDRLRLFNPQVEKVKERLLQQVEGVLAIHEFHVWQLAGNRIIASGMRVTDLTKLVQSNDEDVGDDNDDDDDDEDDGSGGGGGDCVQSTGVW